MASARPFRTFVRGGLVACLLLLPTAARADEPRTEGDAALFQIFLKDGRTLTSYGEPARIADRVIFSMPLATGGTPPPLQLLELSADDIDWTKTDQYAEAARASRYFATRAESDYAVLTTQIQRWLDDAGLESSAAARLTIVERARKVLAEWPATHYGYKGAEVRQIVSSLDEIIADLRAQLGMQRFDLSLVTVAAAPPPAAAPAPLAPPTERDLIDQMITAASVAPSSIDRESILTAASKALEGVREAPADWAASARATITAALNRERETDRMYDTLRNRVLAAVSQRAKEADVRGIEQLVKVARSQDEAMNNARPDVMAALMTSINEQLDAARRLRLARDKWQLRLPALRRYQRQMSASLRALGRVSQALDDIKALAGSGPDEIGAILRAARAVRTAGEAATPPEGLESTHALILSAAQLAESAATLRRQAALTGSMAQAWNASSAAAGALMLTTRFHDELNAAFDLPQLPQ